MPTHLLLDGDDLRSLMLRVREEMGPEARIVRAERVRTGGVAGFFAKEHYELTVEVPERGRPNPLLRPAGVATTDLSGLDALLAAADAAERHDAGPGPASGRLTAVPQPAVRPAPAATTTPAPLPTLAGVGEPERSPAEPQLSTTGPTFAEVLDSMRHIVGAEEPVERAYPDADAAPSPREHADVTPPARPELPRQNHVEVPAGGDRAADRADGSHRPPSSVMALLGLGLPTRMFAGYTDPHAVVPLSTLVRRFDPAPPVRLGPGAVVVVAGEPRQALRTGIQMALRGEVQIGDIVLAGDIDAVPGHAPRLQTAAGAARLRLRVPAGAPTIVVLGVGESEESQERAAALLGALAPDQAWGVVDARRRVVDMRRWLRAVGAERPLDAVAVVGSAEAQAPATVLNLGTPVGWLEGLPASPVVWAALISECLADDVRWD